MQRACLLLMIVWTLLSGRVFATPVEIPTSRDARPMLKSIYAGVHQVGEFKKADTRAIVFFFVGIDCPVSKQYVPRLIALHEQFADKHVQFLAIYADAHVNLLSMATHAHDADIPFPALLDHEYRLTDLLEVTTVPEVVVLDSNLEKRYQGAIDNQYTKRGQLEKPTKNHLSDALSQIIAGEQVEANYVSPSGCPLERERKTPTKKDLTFHRDIAPLLQRHCQDCHRSGGAAPFELMSRDDVVVNSEKIEEAVTERRMPPWHGFLNPQFGTLLNDKRMSDEEIDTLAAWLRNGSVEGDPKDAPPARKWPSPDAWSIDMPDYVYRIEKPFAVPKSGIIDYQFFRVRLDFPEDRWFRAVEIKPDNAEVVHHIGLHLVESGDKSYSGFLGMATLYGINTQMARLLNDYLPGDTYNAKTYPTGQGVRIPKHTDLIFEIHYTPNNREATTDQSMVGFQWLKDEPQDEVLTRVFRRPIGRFHIPPHHSHYEMSTTFYFEKDVEIDAIRPHFHRRGKTYRLEIIERDKATDAIVKRTTVLSVPAYDFNWQRTYELAKPLRILAGTELMTTAHFDNSDLNPNNPDPSATVYYGEGTADEMFSTRFKYRIIHPAASKTNDTAKHDAATQDALSSPAAKSSVRN